MIPYRSSLEKDPILLALNGFLLLIVVGFFAAIVWLVYSVANEPPRAVPAFSEGQMVRMKAFGVTGMVIGTFCWRSHCSYDVRFPSMQIRIPNGGLFNNGGPVDFAPVSRVNVREFEIEAN